MSEAEAGPAEAPVAAAPPGEATCPRCHAPPSPGPWCMACGAAFDAKPVEGTVPPGGAVAARKFACGGCGALMLFDATTGALKCGFCGGTEALPKDDDYSPVEHALEHVPADRQRTEAPKVFRCEDCGAEVAFTGAVVASRCPFCGAEHVVERRGDVGRILPASVLPFAVDRDGACARWRTWLGKGLFRPRKLASLASGEALSGVYVPFWTFDTQAWSRWTAEAGWHYTVTVSDGRGGTRHETRTRWEPASGQREDFYDDVPVCASKGVDGKLVRKLEPIDLAGLRPYRAEFLSGWLAEEYVLELPAGWEVARERVNASQVQKCSHDVPGDTQRNLRVWTQHHDVTWKHVLLPVWIATYRYRDKPYRFLVNGQSGKVVGTAPVSPWKVLVAVLLAAAVVAAVVWLVRR